MGIKYQPPLDGLRGVAVLAVMGFHFHRPIATGGSLGVDIFFVLSGYLITAILVHEHAATGRIDYRAFLLRRARRLLPALFAVLIFCAVVGSVFWADPAAMRADIAAAAFYVTNFKTVIAPSDHALAHTWSLSIEEQFYILWPWALLLMVKLRRETAAHILLAAWLLLTLLRAGLFVAWPENNPSVYYLTPLHATGLLLGAALALRPIEGRTGSAAMAALLVLVVGGMTTKAFIIGGMQAKMFLFAIPAAEIATVLVIANPPRLLSVFPLRWLGRISYGVYLWHIPVQWLFRDDAGPAALAALSILMGAASYYLVEPWTMRRNRLRPALTKSGNRSQAA